MIAPIARIAARYIAGALMAYGIIPSDEAAILEPEIALAVGAVIGALTEAIYAVAIKKGWTK